MLIETHAHLDYPDFVPDFDEVLRRATEAGVTRILTIGTSITSSRRAVELVRLGGKPVTQIARDLGISYSCLRNWVRQADIDEGAKQGLTGDERAELVRLRRENRVQAMEIEILKRASALFARDHVLPK